MQKEIQLTIAETPVVAVEQPITLNAKNLPDNTFSAAVEITRANVKHFYKKAGYIRVVDRNGKTLHTGTTKNMGKVFSNYVNCANYNQSYDFNLACGDRLLFVEVQ